MQDRVGKADIGPAEQAGEKLLRRRQSAFPVADLHEDVSSDGTRRVQGLGISRAVRKLEAFLGVSDRAVVVVPRKPDQCAAGVALSGQVVRRSRLDLRKEPIRAVGGRVPLSQLVLRIDEDGAEPPSESHLAVLLGFLLRLAPELERLAQLAARPQPCGEIPHTATHVEDVVGRARDVDTERDLLQSAVIPEGAAGRADVDESGRLDVVEAEILGHRQALLAHPDRLLVLGREHQQARGGHDHTRLDSGCGQRVDATTSLVEVLHCGVAVTCEPEMLTESDLRLDRTFHVPGGEERVPGALEHRHIRLPEQIERPPQPQKEPATVGIVLAGQVECGPEESGSCVVGVQGERAVPGIAQGGSGRVGERRGGISGRSGQLEGLEVVVREHLGVVLAPPELLDPGGGKEVLLGAVLPRDLPVRDVAHEQVAEGVLAVALDGAAALPPDELLPLQGAQPRVERPPAVQPHQCAGPETRADHRRILEQRLLVGLEQVEPGGDQTLDGLRQRTDLAAVTQHARELLGVERIATGAGEELRVGLRREHRAEQLREQARDVLIGERGERDGERVRLAAAQFGRRERNSGLAVPTTSRGTPVAHSTRPSTKSRR
jgi:hypothetical protein